MRVRIMVTGVVAGAICVVALYLQYYRFAPSDFVPGWRFASQAASMPAWISTVVILICAVTLFAFGWVAARWSWTGTWQASVLAGAGMGTLAGCLVYGIMGLFWYGLLGQADVLKNFYTPVTEVEGTKIIVEALFRTGTLVYINSILVIPACIVLGALGGLASAWVDVKDVWGRRPGRARGWLFRLSAYLLTICGILNMIVTIAVLSTVWDKAVKSGVELQQQYGVTFEAGSEYGYFLQIAYLVGLMFTYVPAGLTWGWIIRTWKQRGKPHPLSLLWLIFTVVGAGYYILKLAGAVNIGMGLDMAALFSILPLASLLALFAGLFAGLMAEPLSDENHPRSSSDWFGYLVSYGILGGTQIMMGAPAMSIPVALIAIVNIPHLVSSEVVEKTPANQVAQLFGMQIYGMGSTIVLSMLIGLVVAGLVAFLRWVFETRELPPKPKDIHVFEGDES